MDGMVVRLGMLSFGSVPRGIVLQVTLEQDTIDDQELQYIQNIMGEDALLDVKHVIYGIVDEEEEQRVTFGMRQAYDVFKLLHFQSVLLLQ
jgi:hypothetical protein